MHRPLLSTLLLVALVSGCSDRTRRSAKRSSIDSDDDAPRTSAPTGPSMPGKPAAPLVFERTSALIKDASLAALVDDLATEKSVESSHVGAGGVASGVYA